MMSLAIYSEVERMIARGEQIKRNPRKKGNFGITGTKKQLQMQPNINGDPDRSFIRQLWIWRRMKVCRSLRK